MCSKDLKFILTLTLFFIALNYAKIGPFWSTKHLCLKETFKNGLVFDMQLMQNNTNIIECQYDLK